MGKFVITKRKNGEFQFSLKATNGQEILGSDKKIKDIIKNILEY